MSGHNQDEKHSYKYYAISDSTPVRVVFNGAGHKLGAETPDPETKTLKIQHSLLETIETSPDAEEISKDHFEALCKITYAKKKPDFQEPRAFLMN